jgi:hypothetical protein
MGFMLQPQPLCEQACNEFCLVITTLTLSVGMEGSWHATVGEKFLRIAFVYAGEPRLKSITEPGHRVVLQQEYGSRQRVVIDCPTAICSNEPKRASQMGTCSRS